MVRFEDPSPDADELWTQRPEQEVKPNFLHCVEELMPQDKGLLSSID